MMYSPHSEMIKKFQEIGLIMIKPTSRRPRSLRTKEYVESVNESTRDDPNLSFRKRLNAFFLHRSLLNRILRKDFKLHRYKI